MPIIKQSIRSAAHDEPFGHQPKSNPMQIQNAQSRPTLTYLFWKLQNASAIDQTINVTHVSCWLWWRHRCKLALDPRPAVRITKLSDVRSTCLGNGVDTFLRTTSCIINLKIMFTLCPNLFDAEAKLRDRTKTRSATLKGRQVSR